MRASAPCLLPVLLGQRAGEGRRSIPIRIGDDIPAASRSGVLQEVTLRLKVTGAAEGRLLRVEFDGMGIDKAGTSVHTSQCAEQPLSPTAVKQGTNELKVALARRGATAEEALTLQEVSVLVRYCR